jgi:hypothetical protein
MKIDIVRWIEKSHSNPSSLLISYAAEGHPPFQSVGRQVWLYSFKHVPPICLAHVVEFDDKPIIWKVCDKTFSTFSDGLNVPICFPTPFRDSQVAAVT